jgi:hypothetical protein
MRAQNVPTPPSAEHQNAESDYAAMLARVQQGDMSVDFRAFRSAGAQKSGPHASIIEIGERNAFGKLAVAGDWAGALASAKQALDRDYASPVAQYNAMLACAKLQQTNEAASHAKILDVLLDSIRQSGDGKSAETAYFVVTGQEEYVFLARVLHLRPKGQSLVGKGGHYFDCLHVVDPATNQPQDVWFNADFDFGEELANMKPKDGAHATATVAPAHAPQGSLSQEAPSGPAPTAQPSDQPVSPNVEPQTPAEKPVAENEPVVRWASFHLVQGAAPWGLTYNIAGSYKLRAHSVTMSIETGSARISDSRPADETSQLRVLQLGVCYSRPGGNGNWDVYPPKGPRSVNLPLDNVVLKKGDNFNFPNLTVVVPLPDEPLPPNNWLCSSLESQIGGSATVGYYPAHDEYRPMVFPNQSEKAAQPKDRLESASISLAGPGAVDCGRVPPHGDPKEATDCTLNAVSHRTPFRVRYDLQGIDSFPALGIVGTSDGKLYELHFDSDAMGHGRRFGAQTLQTLSCPEPPVLSQSHGRLTCLANATPEYPPKRTVIEYGRYGGSTLQMVVNETGRGEILLRVAVGKDAEPIDTAEIDRAIFLLKKEGSRLTSTTCSGVLGESGYRFKLEAGYPFLNPKEEVADGIVFEDVLLAEKAKVVDRLISGKGADGWVSTRHPTTGPCSDPQKIFASIPRDTLSRLKSAMTAENLEEAVQIANEPKSGLIAFTARDGRGQIVGFRVDDSIGCAVAAAGRRLLFLPPQPKPSGPLFELSP